MGRVTTKFSKLKGGKRLPPSLSSGWSSNSGLIGGLCRYTSTCNGYTSCRYGTFYDNLCNDTSHMYKFEVRATILGDN